MAATTGEGDGERHFGEALTRSRLRFAVAAVAVVWLPSILLWGDAPFAITFDDAYYYFEIGRNLADGHGSTFDTINQTNGYHPLWLGVTTVPYLAGLEGLGAVRALLVGQLAAWLVTLTLVTRVAVAESAGYPGLEGRPDREADLRRIVFTVTIVLTLFAANPFVVKMFVNGLESGPAALVHAGLLVVAWRRDGRLSAGSRGQRLVVGGLLALAFLARTDAILLIGCLGLWTLADLRGPDRPRLASLVELYVAPAVTMVAYFAVNIAAFGDPMQVSGEVKRLDLTSDRASTLVLFAALAMALGALARRRLRSPARALPRTGRFFGRTGFYASFCVLLLAYYTTLSAQQWLWYFAPVALYLLFLLVLVTVDFTEGVIAEAGPDRAPGRRLVTIQAIVLLPLAVGLGLQLPQFLEPDVRSIQVANRDAGVWISENLPADAVLASWDAGVVGYFTDQPVMNLDGVVNSFAWVEATRTGGTAAFLRDRGLTHIVNHDVLVDGDARGIEADVAGLLGDDAAATITLIHRVDFRYVGRIEGEPGSGPRDMAVFVHAVPPAD